MNSRAIFLLCLLSSLAAAAEDQDRIDALIELLADPDPGCRSAALSALGREGPEAAERMCAYLDHPNAHLRRIVNERLHGVMRHGGDGERLLVVRGLIRVGQASRSFLPLLQAIGQESNEVGWLAQVAEMRLVGDRRNVERLANTPEALKYLREFDPERADALALVADLRIELSGLPQSELVTQMRSAQVLLAQAHPGFTGFLAARLQRCPDDDLVEWLRITASLRETPGGIGPSLAHRVEHGSPGALREIGRRLAWSRPMHGEIAFPVRRAAWKRLRHFPDGEVRAHLLRMLDACEYPERELLPLLERECGRSGFVGVTAASILALRAPGLAADPVELYGSQPNLDRRAVLHRIAHAGSAIYLPIVESVLRNGEEVERGTVLERAHEFERCRTLLPALRHCLEQGTAWEAGRAVRAAARCDPSLADPLTACIVSAGLTDERPELLRSAVYACDELDRFTEELAAALEALLEVPEARRPMEVFLTNSVRLRRNGLPLVPMLARIVVEGPPEAMQSGAAEGWESIWIRRSIETLGRIDVTDARVRAALRSALRSERYWIRHFALLAYERLRSPEALDIAAVRKLVDETTQGQDLDLALDLLERWKR